MGKSIEEKSGNAAEKLKQITDMIDLFYANKHLYERIFLHEIDEERRMTKLDGGYIRGYTRAIVDIIEIFAYVDKAITNRTSKMLLDCILKNRAKIRDFYDQGFIRWNNVLNNFEWYEPPKKG